MKKSEHLLFLLPQTCSTRALHFVNNNSIFLVAQVGDFGVVFDSSLSLTPQSNLSEGMLILP